MNPNSLDDQLSEAWSATTATAALEGAPNHAATMRRVRSRRRRTYALRGTATAVACVAIGGGGLAVANTLKAQGITPGIGGAPSDSPSPSTGDPSANPAAGEPVTLLVARAFDMKPSDVPEMRALDFATLVHFSADRSRVEVVPLSRVAEVDASDCGLDPSKVGDASLTLVKAFNAGAGGDAVASTGGMDVAGGLRCVSTAVTSTTGVPIDGYAFTNFEGFIEAVDALDGVEVCVPEALAAPEYELGLSAGWQTLDGASTLGMARSRLNDSGGLATVDPRLSREGRIYAALLTAALTDPSGSAGTGEGADVLNALLDEVRTHGEWTVETVAAPLSDASEGHPAPWDGDAQAVFDALAADDANSPDPADCP